MTNGKRGSSGIGISTTRCRTEKKTCFIVSNNSEVSCTARKIVFSVIPHKMIFSVIPHVVFNYEGKVTEFPDYDFGISFLYPFKVPESQLHKPWFNFHPAPLPECGGRNVAYHAIMNGMSSFGGTIHYMNEEFDRGPIIETKRFAIGEGDTAGDLVMKSHAVLLELLRKYLPFMLNGPLPKAIEQSDTTYHTAEKLDDYIELNESQEKRIRALTVSPVFSAKVRIGDRDYKIVPCEELR